ncbi:MAG: MFS transporter [Proteobacteria bacterium]|nr:MFS transporter [Pseudomonadota bacterium]
MPPPAGLFRIVVPFVPVLIGAALNGFASGALSVLIGVRLAAGASPVTTIGLVLACHFIGLIVGTRLCPRLIVFTGHPRAFTIFTGLAATFTLVLPIFEGPTAWAALRLGTGFCMAGCFTVLESWLNQQVDPAFRARTFAIYMICSSGASAIAPMSLNLVDPFGFQLFSLIAVSFILAPLAMVLIVARVPVLEGRSNLNLLALLSVSPGGVLACLIHGLLNGALYQVTPVYFARLGFDTGQLTIFLTVAATVGVMTQMPVGLFADRIGRHRLLLCQSAVAGIAALPLAIFGAPPFPVVMGFGLIVAAMAHTFYSLGVAIANDRLAQRDFVEAAGGLLLVWAAGSAAGPVIATALIDWLGPAGLYVHIVLAAAALAAIVVHRMIVRPPPPPSAPPPVAPAAT